MCPLREVRRTAENTHELLGWETHIWFGAGDEVDILNSKYFGAIPFFITISYNAKLLLIMVR